MALFQLSFTLSDEVRPDDRHESGKHVGAEGEDHDGVHVDPVPLQCHVDVAPERGEERFADEVAGGGVGHALGGPGASLRDVTGAMTQFFFQLVQFGV